MGSLSAAVMNTTGDELRNRADTADYSVAVKVVIIEKY